MYVANNQGRFSILSSTIRAPDSIAAVRMTALPVASTGASRWSHFIHSCAQVSWQTFKGATISTRLI